MPLILEQLERRGSPTTAQAKAALQLRIAAVDSVVMALTVAVAVSMGDPAVEHVLGGKRAEAAALRKQLKALKPLRFQAEAAVATRDKLHRKVSALKE